MPWFTADSGVTKTLSGAAASATAVIIVGNDGTILRSTDGENYDQITSGTSEDLLAVDYGNGRFIVSGFNGTILYSDDDGTTFTDISIETTRDFFEITNNKSGRWIIGTSSSKVIISTNNGDTWSGEISLGGAGLDCQSLAWSGSNFIYSNLSSLIKISPNGESGSWTNIDIPSSYANCSYSDGNGTVVIGLYDDEQIGTSFDHGLNFSYYTFANVNNLSAIATYEGHWFVAGSNSTEIHASADNGATWSIETKPTGFTLTCNSGCNLNSRVIMCCNQGGIIYRDIGGYSYTARIFTNLFTPPFCNIWTPL